MSEGGLLLWKRQDLNRENEPTYIDVSLKSLMEPLPPPPRGKEWMRLTDGQWALLDKQGPVDSDSLDQGSENSSEEEKGDETPAFLSHVIMPEDTLTGICLKYKVTKKDLHKHNDFFGDHFRLCKVLTIPNKLGDEHTNRSQQPSRDVILQKFKYATNLSDREATFYLDMHNWNYTSALESYKDDAAWESSQQPRERGTESRTDVRGGVVSIRGRDDRPPILLSYGRGANGNVTETGSFVTAVTGTSRNGISSSRPVQPSGNTASKRNAQSAYTVDADGTIELTASESLHAPLLGNAMSY